MALSSRDRRYEPYIPPLPCMTQRVAETVTWRRWRLHVEHVGDPDSPVQVLLIHGAGGNAAAMWPFAAHIAALGAYVTVVDLPGYGRSIPPYDGRVTYDDWRGALAFLARRIDDGRPLALVGASMGGMLAYDTAASTGLGSLVVATCLLDTTDPVVLERITRRPWLGRLAGPLLRMVRGPLSWVPLPMQWVAPMRLIANDEGLTTEVVHDRRGGRRSMPLGWFRTFLAAGPIVAPEEYDGPPVLLVHPDEDRWTPLSISERFFDRIRGEKRLVVLEGAGHFPVEEPGFSQLMDALAEALWPLAPVDQEHVRDGAGRDAEQGASLQR